MSKRDSIIQNQIYNLEQELKNNSDLSEEEKKAIDMKISNLYYDLED
jgi:hypothetical protein